MNYSNEYIIAELMRVIGFNRQQAERVLVQYDCNGELDDLISVIECKNDVSCRL